MKKLVWIINQYAVPIAESARQIKLAQFLMQNGYDVLVVCGSKVHNQDKNLIEDKTKYLLQEFQGVQFMVVKSGNYVGNGIKRVIASINFQKSVMKIAKKMPKPYAVVSDFAGLFGNRFLKFKTKYKARFVLDILDLWPESFVDFGYLKQNSIITKILYRMEHKAYRVADEIIFSFQGGKDYIKEKKWDTISGGDVDLEKIHYLNNGIDLSEILLNREKYILDDPDLKADGFKAVYLGSIRTANNVSAIVEGAEYLQKLGNNTIKILVYGDGDKREELEKYCVEHNVNNLVFKGRLPIQYAPYVLNKCNVNILNWGDAPLLRFGSSPNKLFMYFSSERPVLSLVSPAYDLIKENNCGIVTTNKPEDMANGLLSFYNMDSQKYEEYCANCRRVAKEYDYKVLVNVLIQAIEMGKKL